VACRRLRKTSSNWTMKSLPIACER
jgi:hypothetical protein